MHLLLHWWYTISGANNEGGPVYGSWSGFLGSIQPTLLGSAVLIYWHHTCHESPLCLRWGKHPDASGIFRYCRVHHPELAGQKLTREFRHGLHHGAKAR